MSTVLLVVSIAAGLTIAESRLSRANERALRERGARAPARDLYAVVAVLYPALLVAMGAEGVWRAARNTGLADSGPSWFASGALLFAASKALKYWAIGALKERWTFRVLVLPGVPLVTSGPYRYVAHPNFLAVVGELAGTAMMCGAPITGTSGVLLYSGVLWARARYEERAIRELGAMDRS
jgi:methyltransferase